VVKVGQSAKSVKAGRNRGAAVPSLSIFPTNLGWFGLLGRDSRLVTVVVGHASADDVRRACRRDHEISAGPDLREHDWNPKLRRRLERYCIGERCEFDDVPLELPDRTEFQQPVLKVTRRIPYGQTMSYGQLAEKAGYPRAARAVGSVMSSNRFPIVVPCHRVLASGGKTGGYTSPQGVSLKLRLLALEGASVPVPAYPRDAACGLEVKRRKIRNPKS
jgi:methylated-DNA-[protein]-cysteine S-methyltransferase